MLSLNVNASISPSPLTKKPFVKINTCRAICKTVSQVVCRCAMTIARRWILSCLFLLGDNQLFQPPQRWSRYTLTRACSPLLLPLFTFQLSFPIPKSRFVGIETSLLLIDISYTRDVDGRRVRLLIQIIYLCTEWEAEYVTCVDA
jgi:hypothetical protein